MKPSVNNCQSLNMKIKVKSHNNIESFFSYWVMLNDLNESVNKIKD